MGIIVALAHILIYRRRFCRFPHLWDPLREVLGIIDLSSMGLFLYILCVLIDKYKQKIEIKKENKRKSRARRAPF